MALRNRTPMAAIPARPRPKAQQSNDRGNHETKNLSPGFVVRAGRGSGGWIDPKPLYRMVAGRTGHSRGDCCSPDAARQENQKASQGLNESRAEDWRMYGIAGKSFNTHSRKFE